MTHPDAARGAPCRLALLAITLATAIGVAACGGGPTTGPTAAPGSSVPATTEPGTTPAPTGEEPAPTGEEPTPTGEEPTPTEPGATPRPGSTVEPPATGAPTPPDDPAAACTGNDENRAFFAGVAEAVAWDVYCPVLPGGWFVDTGSFRLAGGGRMEISYKGPGGARLEIRQGFYCAGQENCIPDAPTAGTAAFGSRPARLLDLGDGRWLIVAEDGAVAWEVRSSGLDRETALAYAAAFARVAG